MISRRGYLQILGVVLIIFGFALQLPVSSATRAAASVDTTSTSSAFNATKVMTRDQLKVDGSVQVVDTRTFSVTVDRDTGLRGNQQLDVSWSGAHPTRRILSILLVKCPLC